MTKTVLSIFTLGVTFGFTSCWISCAPVVLGLTVAGRLGFLKSLYSYLVFSLGRIVVYMFLSVGVYFAGDFISTAVLSRIHPVINIMGGIFIIALGIISIIGDKARWCAFLYNRFMVNQKKSAFVSGLIIGFVPCAPFLAVLSLIVLVSKSWVQSLGHGFVFGLGTMVSPLALAVVAGGGLRAKKFIANERVNVFIRLSAGIMLIIFGMYIIIRPQ